MPQIRLLHCADVHLGADNAYLGPRAETRKTELLRTFERMLDLCRAQNAPLLLIAGDLFDRADPDETLRRAVLEGLGSLPDTRVYVAAGNHDPACAGSVWSGPLPDRVFCFGADFSCDAPDELPVRVWGASFANAYCDASPLPTARRDDGRLNLLVLHGDLGGAGRYRPLTPAALAATGMDYVALGHVHACSGVQRAGTVYYAYPGCPEGQGYDETGEKGVLAGTVSPGQADLRLVPIARRRHYALTADLDGVASNAEAEARLRALLPAAAGEDWPDQLYRIRAVGRPAGAIDLDLLAARLAEQVYDCRLVDERLPAVDLAALAQEPSLRGFFVRALTERMAGAPPEQCDRLRLALRLGLDAFETEVRYRAD